MQAVVADEEAPTAPSNVQTSVTGNTVTVTWGASTDNVAVTGYEVHRSDTADFTPSGATFITEVDGSTLSVVNGSVPAGTSYYKIVALDAAGNTTASDPVEAVVADGEAPSAPGNVTADVVGDTVTVTWEASTDDAGVTGYTVHRGDTAGFTPDGSTEVGDVDGSTLSFEETSVPAGAWFYRVVAGDAAGNASSSDPAVEAVVADDEAPSAPSNVQTSVTGNTVTVTWDASSDNVGVTGYEVHRSGSAGFVPDGSTLLGGTGGATLSYADQDVAVGSWFYRVVALDAAGSSAVSDPAVEAVVTDGEAPSAPANVAADVSGSDVSVTWDASTDDVGVTGYTVHRGDSAGFTPDGSTEVGDVDGSTLSFEETSVPAGAWFYRVVAGDAAGNASSSDPAVEAVVADEEAPSAPSNVQTSVTGNTVTVTWDASSDNVGVTGYEVHRSDSAGFVPDGSTLLGGTGGATVSYADQDVAVGSWFYRVVALDAAGSSAVSDPAVEAVVADVPVTVTLGPVADTYVQQNLPDRNFGSGATMSVATSPGRQALLRFDLPELASGQTVTGATLRLRVPGDSWAGTTSDVEVRTASNDWQESTVTWTSRPTIDSGVVGLLGGGAAPGEILEISLTASDLVGLMGGEATLALVGTTSDSLGVYSRDFSSVSARPQLILDLGAAVADNEAPSAPSNVQTSVTGNTVTVTWDASSDNVGVTGYEVHRSGSAGFVPDGSTLLGGTGGATLSYADQDVAVGSWFYRVVALDAAGSSAVSDPAVEAVVADVPVTVTLGPVADTYVQQNLPDRNFGSGATMSVATSPGRQALLRFDLPELASGQTVTGATLRLRVPGDSWAGTTSDVEVRTASNDWQESTVTWTSRPTIDSGVVGLLGGGAAPGEILEISLTASDLVGLMGGEATLALVGTTSDSLGVYSRDFSSVSARPQLILDLGAAVADNEAPSAPSNVAAVVPVVMCRCRGMPRLMMWG